MRIPNSGRSDTRTMHRIDSQQTWPLHGVQASRELEALTAAPPHTLMQKAGLSVARLARALAPHARHVWVACGPGNNGGDGFEAALHLKRQGLDLTLTWLSGQSQPSDARASRERALHAGVRISDQPPGDFDLAIDALLGLGGGRPNHGGASPTLVDWLERLSETDRPVLAVDLPSGLDGDTGAGVRFSPRPRRRHTLSLLTLKPGLFTAQGRDQAGQVWFDDLGADLQAVAADAYLLGADKLPSWDKAQALHDSHKGRYGDVLVVGGQSQAPHMTGAALLAARAALHAGAGRIFVCSLGPTPLKADPVQPELMFRELTELGPLHARMTIVCGCGGGGAVTQVLPHILGCEGPLVLDADALNAIAEQTQLRLELQQRSTRPTLITPHPLEAARLLDCPVSEVQADRIAAARALCEALSCTVVLKGSGSVIASPNVPPVINPTGNALLATAGTGDVLAGLIGAALAGGLTAHEAACLSVFRHGRAAEIWAQLKPGQALVASDLLGH